MFRDLGEEFASEVLKVARILIPHLGRTLVLAVRLVLAVLVERFVIWLLGARGNAVDVIHLMTVTAAVVMLSWHFLREIALAIREYQEGD